MRTYSESGKRHAKSESTVNYSCRMDLNKYAKVRSEWQADARLAPRAERCWIVVGVWSLRVQDTVVAWEVEGLVFSVLNGWRPLVLGGGSNRRSSRSGLWQVVIHSVDSQEFSKYDKSNCLWSGPWEGEGYRGVIVESIRSADGNGVSHTYHKFSKFIGDHF